MTTFNIQWFVATLILFKSFELVDLGPTNNNKPMSLTPFCYYLFKISNEITQNVCNLFAFLSIIGYFQISSI